MHYTWPGCFIYVFDRVQEAELGVRESAVSRDLRGLREEQVNLESRVGQEKRARLDHKDRQDHLGLQEQM